MVSTGITHTHTHTNGFYLFGGFFKISTKLMTMLVLFEVWGLFFF